MSQSVFLLNYFANMKALIYVTIFIIFLSSCSSSRKVTAVATTTNAKEIRSTVVIKKKVPAYKVNTGKITPDEVVTYAESLAGIRYTYGGTSISKGFDCSGLVNFVFGHFNIAVPRISWQFTNAGMEVPIADSRRGDIILFTGQDVNSGVVGHLGIIISNEKGNIEFIHSAERGGVMISEMNSYFIPRFVKVNRVFLPDK